MATAYIIYKGSLPSICHTRYMDKALAEAEVTRLETLREEHNKQVEENPATGKGACFMNMKLTDKWSYKELEVPD